MDALDQLESVPVTRSDEPRYASWGRRAVALACDVIVIVVSIIGLYLVAWVAGGYDYGTDTLSDTWLAVYLPLFVLGPPVYFWLMVARYRATLGKLRLASRFGRATVPVVSAMHAPSGGSARGCSWRGLSFHFC